MARKKPHDQRLKAFKEKRAAVQADLAASTGEPASALSSKHDTDKRMDASDDSMSDDGGALLNVQGAQSVTDISTPPRSLYQAHSSHHPRTHLPSQAFLQNPSTFVVPGTQLWRLPVEPAQGLRHSQLRAEVGKGAEFLYHHDCQLIQRNWECDPAQALPDMFHEFTPYSLALLQQLRRLSGKTKKNKLHVHAILHEQWLQRVSTLGSENPFGERTFTTTTVAKVIEKWGAKREVCETQIQENIYGVMLEDVVCKAMKDLVKAVKLSERTGGPVDVRLVSDVEPAWQEWKKCRGEKKAARKVAARERDFQLSRKTSAAGQMHPRGSARMATQPSQPFYSPRFRPSHPSPLLSLDDVRAARMADHPDGIDSKAAEPNASMPPDEDEYKQLSKSERHAYNRMAELLARGACLHDLPTTKKQGRRVRRGMQHTASMPQQPNAESSALPSERFDLSAMPSLHASMGTVQEGEMAEAMNALDLAQLGQQPLPALLGN